MTNLTQKAAAGLILSLIALPGCEDKSKSSLPSPNASNPSTQVGRAETAMAELMSQSPHVAERLKQIETRLNELEFSFKVNLDRSNDRIWENYVSFDASQTEGLVACLKTDVLFLKNLSGEIDYKSYHLADSNLPQKVRDTNFRDVSDRQTVRDPNFAEGEKREQATNFIEKALVNYGFRKNVLGVISSTVDESAVQSVRDPLMDAASALRTLSGWLDAIHRTTINSNPNN